MRCGLFRFLTPSNGPGGRLDNARRSPRGSSLSRVVSARSRATTSARAASAASRCNLAGAKIASRIIPGAKNRSEKLVAGSPLGVLWSLFGGGLRAIRTRYRALGRGVRAVHPGECRFNRSPKSPFLKGGFHASLRVVCSARLTGSCEHTRDRRRSGSVEAEPGGSCCGSWNLPAWLHHRPLRHPGQRRRHESAV